MIIDRYQYEGCHKAGGRWQDSGAEEEYLVGNEDLYEMDLPPFESFFEMRARDQVPMLGDHEFQVGKVPNLELSDVRDTGNSW